MIEVNCPCGASLNVPVKYAGSWCRCKQCGKRLSVPRQDVAPIAPSVLTTSNENPEPHCFKVAESNGVFMTWLGTLAGLALVLVAFLTASVSFLAGAVVFIAAVLVVSTSHAAASMVDVLVNIARDVHAIRLRKP